jgi:hypothetical protein
MSEVQKCRGQAADYSLSDKDLKKELRGEKRALGILHSMYFNE